MRAFITVWNRFSWLIPLCENYKKAGLDLHLIDNASTYEPCVKWLEKCPYKVIRMNGNYSPWAFFTSDLWKEYKDRYVFISDSDYDFDNVPSDFVDVLMDGLTKYTTDNVWKVGLSCEINDLPDNDMTRKVIEHEKGFWNNEIIPGYYRADIDTGPALYDRSRREGSGLGGSWYSALRTARPYTCRHLDWYLTPETLRDEDIYFLKAKGKAHHGWTWYAQKFLNVEYND